MKNSLSHRFKQKDQIFLWFEKHLKEHVVYYPLVSWWPDSMLMIHCLFDYFFTRWRDVSTIHPVYINHKQRKESDKEESFLSTYFSQYGIIIRSLRPIKWQNVTENNMRKERWQIMKNIIEEYGQGTLLTWHNLSDRVETSFLHLLRGCKLPGVINMCPVDTKRLGSENLPLLRPLLHLPKETIHAICIQCEIPFFIDPSNADVTLSQRNGIRKKLHIFLSKYTTDTPTWEGTKELFWKQTDVFYTDIENSLPSSYYPICVLKPSIHWDVQNYCQTRLPQTSWNVYNLFSTLGIVWWVTQTLLDEYAQFFKITTSGWKWYQWWYLIISHGKLYCLQKPFDGDFWKRQPDPKSLAIDSLGVYTLGDFQRNITDMTYLWWIIRYPQTGDMRKGKKLMKYLLNSKIPVLWRNYCPVIEKDNHLIAILDPSYLLWYM